jgi:hypothetical protein
LTGESSPQTNVGAKGEFGEYGVKVKQIRRERIINSVEMLLTPTRVSRAELFLKGALLGVCASLIALVVNYGLFWVLKPFINLSESYFTYVFYTVNMFEALIMIGVGVRYSEQEISVSVNILFPEDKTVVVYPRRPLLCLTLMIGGIVLMILLLLVIFTAPPAYILH